AGQIVAPAPRAFAAALLAVPTVREERVAAVARQAAERFSVDGQLERMLDVYESLVRPARIA
ncbi:MAG TPA: hypothetical protein VIJ77_03300, partial [Candidatus Tumulicola sp.]